MTTTPASGLATAVHLARLEIVSAVRAKVFNASFFILPILFLLIIVFGIVAPKLEEAKASEKVTHVAVRVAADAGPEPRAIVDALRASPPPKVQLRDEPDPLGVVGAEQAEAGLIVGRDTIETISLPSVAKSRLGLTRLRDALASAEVARARAAGSGISAVTVSRVDLQKTSRGRRFALGDLVPIYLIFQLMNVGISAATAVRGDKETRSIESLLTLPTPRWSILAGKAAGVVFEGLARLVVLMVVIVAATRTSVAGLHLEIAPASVLTMGVVGVGLVVTYVGVGMVAGVAARSPGQEAAAAGALSVGSIATGLAVQQLKVAGGSALVRCVPIVGPVLTIRGVIFDAVGPGQVAISFVAALAAGLGAMAIAARLLRRDGLTLRDS